MENLINTQDRLINYLESNGYSTNYIHCIRKEIEAVLHMRDLGTWVSYENLYEMYRSSEYSANYVRCKKAFLSVIAKFETENIYPGTTLGLCKFRRSYFKEDSFKKLSIEFQDVLLNYVSTEESRGLKKSTISVAFQCVVSFLHYMQYLGLTTLREIKEENVLDFFFSSDEHQKRGCTCKRHIKKALEYYAEKHPESRGVATYLPNIKGARKNIQYLTREEISKVKLALNDYDNALDYRDRAVGTLLLYTGLRSCDIANLKMEDIRWKEDVIILYQQKTGAGLALPLRPIVGNAIFNYVSNERPQVVGGNLFLSKKQPHKGIRAMKISNGIVGRIFNIAGIRLNKGDRRGSHIFRHHLAISLLENEVPQPIISNTLGHESPQSTETYLNADFAHLKECAIDISKYPISEEVFNVF